MKHPSKKYPRRFKVALSFPGAKRDFVRTVANSLLAKIKKSRLFYDKWYQAELAMPELDIVLGKIYHEDSDLLVVFLCAEYDSSRWCGLEWRQMRSIMLRAEGHRIMIFRFDDTVIAGMLELDGYIQINPNGDVSDTEEVVTPDQVTQLILERLKLLNRRSAKP